LFYSFFDPGPIIRARIIISPLRILHIIILTPLSLYTIYCGRKEERLKVRKELVMKYPDTYEAYISAMHLADMVGEREDVRSFLRGVVERYPNSLAALGVRKVITEGELMEGGGR